MDLQYTIPKPILKPLKRGDLVDVMSRDGMRLSTRRVVRAGPRVVVTDCTRRWRATDGRWIGDRVYPFPWIRRSRRKKAGL